MDTMLQAGERRTNVAVIGTGLVGRAWSIVFARAGCRVRTFDRSDRSGERALAEIAKRAADLHAYGLIDDPAPITSAIAPAASVEEAVADAAFVQECIREKLDDKRALFALLDAATPMTTILASSTSAIPPSAFTEALAGRERCCVGHPANPPYLLPVVEVVPAPWTRPDITDATVAFYRSVGQQPIVVKRELAGFILNRLQGALVNEAFRLVAEGYADTDAVDKTIVYGLGPRWAFMGPFETIDLNAPGGVGDYAQRYATSIFDMVREAGVPEAPWSPDLVQTVESERRAVLPIEDLGARVAWRDRRLMALAALRRETAARDES